MNSKDLAQLPNTHLTEKEFLALDRENQEYYLYLLEQEIQLKQSKKLVHYEPHAKQEEFHFAIEKVRALLGGNRSGKTTSGGIEFLFHITGNYPDWYPEEQRLKGRVIGRIAATDFQKGVGEVILPFLDEWLDPELVKKKTKNPMGIPVKWILKNGSSFDILTYEQSTDSYEGWKGHMAWFDEPPPREKYIATLRGLVDFDGRAWMTLTPLTQPWIYDDIYTNPKIKCVNVNIRDNPYLSEEAIADFESSLTEEEKKARIDGKFLHMTGLIYKEFDPSVHVIDPFTIKDSWTRYFCIDPHPRNPTACIWLAVDTIGNFYIYDELWLSDMSIGEIASAIHVQEGDRKAHVRLIDPHMDSEDKLAGGFNVRKELMKNDVFCQRGNSDPILGKSRIREALKLKYSNLYGTEVPKLRIFRSCTQTIYEFQHYIWDEYKRNKEDYDKKETPRKKSDHFMDALRYIFNYDPRLIVQEEEKQEVRYEGKYTKHQVNTSSTVTKYHDLVN